MDARAHVLNAARDQRRQSLSHAVAEHRFRCKTQLRYTSLRLIEIDPLISVDLEINASIYKLRIHG